MNHLRFLVLLTILLASLSVKADKSVDIGDLVYQLNDDKHEASVSSCYRGSNSGIYRYEIPEKINYGGVEYTVVAILDECFYQSNKNVRSVSIPSTVKSLGANCFTGCSSLGGIDLSMVTSLGAGCFSGCSSLKSINLPVVTSLGAYCFSDCTQLTSVKISGPITNLSPGSFSNCGELSSIEIPSTVTALGELCFYDCENLTSINLPSSLTSIENRCFRGCESLASIEIPSTVTTLGNECFYGCKSLTSITPLPSSLTSVGEHCFYGCGIASINLLSSSLTSLPNYCFANCQSLESIVLPHKITSIGSNCFAGCKNLETVQLSSSLTSLPANCFSGCEILQPMAIPNSLTSFGANCFKDCLGFESFSIPNTVTTLGDGCFENCRFLQHISIPNSITKIPKRCFYNCHKIVNLDFPSSIDTIYRNSIAVDYVYLELKGYSYPIKSIISRRRTPPTVIDDSNEQYTPFNYGYKNSTTFWPGVKLYVPDNSKARYRSAKGWELFPDIESLSQYDGTTGYEENVDYISASTVSLVANYEAELNLNLIQSVAKYNSLTFDLTLPAGVSIKTDDNGNYVSTFNELISANGNHKASISKVSDQVYRVTVNSPTNALLTGTNVKLLSITLKRNSSATRGNYKGTITNSAGNTSDTTLRFKDMEFAVRVNVLNCDVDGNGVVNNMDMVYLRSVLDGKIN